MTAPHPDPQPGEHVLVDALVLAAIPGADPVLQIPHNPRRIAPALLYVQPEHVHRVPADEPQRTPDDGVVEHGDDVKGIDGITDGDLVEVVLRGFARNVDAGGRAGPRLTVSPRQDGAAQSSAIYAHDGHVVSVTYVAPPAPPDDGARLEAVCVAAYGDASWEAMTPATRRACRVEIVRADPSAYRDADALIELWT